MAHVGVIIYKVDVLVQKDGGSFRNMERSENRARLRD